MMFMHVLIMCNNNTVNTDIQYNTLTALNESLTYSYKTLNPLPSAQTEGSQWSLDPWLSVVHQALYISAS